MTFASGTSVSSEKSRAELEGLLQKHGAGQRYFGSDDQAGFAIVGFSLDGRQIKIVLPMPKLEDVPFRKDRRGVGRVPKEEIRRKDWEQATRERWRLFVLMVKAKLEYISIGASTVEREFLADVMLLNGKTVSAVLGGDKGELAKMYETGQMPKFLLGA